MNALFAAPDPDDEDYQGVVADELEVQRARRDAKRILDAEDTDYEPLNITNKRVMPDDEAWMVDDLVPTDANILLSARRKTGKTTLVGNLVRSLTRREPFLDEFHVNHKYKVALLDFEMGERMLYSWLTDMDGLMDEPRLFTETFRGRARQLGLLDDKRRDEVARMLDDIGTEIFIVDPIGPILGANRIDENSPAVRFVTGALDQLKLDARISSMVVVAHNGKDNDVGTRGHSSLEDWPDVIWQYKLDDPKDQDSERVLDAYGRIDQVTRVLRFERGSAQPATAEDGNAASPTRPTAGRFSPRWKIQSKPASAAAIWRIAREVGYTSQETAMAVDLRRA